MVQISEITTDATKDALNPTEASASTEPERNASDGNLAENPRELAEPAPEPDVIVEPPAENARKQAPQPIETPAEVGKPIYNDCALRVAYIMRSYLSTRPSSAGSGGAVGSAGEVSSDSTGERCRAMMEVMRTGNGRWSVSKVMLEHSHPISLSDPTGGGILPTVGMDFGSISMAKAFYVAYSEKMGFKAKMASGRRSKGTWMLITQRFFCSKGNYLINSNASEEVGIKRKRGTYKKRIAKKDAEPLEVIQVDSSDERVGDVGSGNQEKDGVLKEKSGEPVTAQLQVVSDPGKNRGLDGKEGGKEKVVLVGNPSQSRLLKELGIGVSKYTHKVRRDMILRYMKKRNNGQVVDRSIKFPSHQALAEMRQRGFGGKFLSMEESQEDLKEHTKPVAKRCRKEAPKAVGTQQAIFLPLDIVANILSRLPVKSLVRFRSVCKQWCSLTSSPDFVDEQCMRALGRPGFISRFCCSHKLSLYDLGDDGEIRDCSFYIKVGKWLYWTLSNSVNGLVYGHSDSSADGCHYLLNPSTRELIELPRSDPYVFSNPGLAFDISTGEYKLVRLFSNKDIRNYCSCEVLSVGTSKWRYVGKLACKLPRSRPVLLNGALHWIVLKFSLHNAPLRQPAILVFDVKNEKFRYMHTPKFSHRLYPFHVALMESEGHLCFVEHPEHLRGRDPTTFLRIWVLRDYKGREWTEKYKIDMSFFLSRPLRPRIVGITCHQILFLWSDDVHSDSLKFYSYDLYTTAFQVLYCGASWALDFFTESLISPRNLAGNLPLL